MRNAVQPPSGGCVLKPEGYDKVAGYVYQPPSGGCVLKQKMKRRDIVVCKSSRLQAAVC